MNTVVNSELATGCTWHISPDADLRLRFWDDECVVHHGASGNTHLLQRWVAELVEALLQADATAVQLAERFDLDVADVERALRETEAIGVAESQA